MCNEKRDVRTLLLCTVHGEHRRAYQEVCSLNPAAKDRRSFFSVGGFDALTIYQTDMNLSPNNDWIESILQDKKAVFEEMTRDVCYHPIHIVANTEDPERQEMIDAFWSEKTRLQYPFLLVTLIYGANHDVKTPYEDHLWQSLSEAESDAYCFAVYNSINLCDLVILWYTNDITKTLKKVREVGFLGLARKTYTFVNIPLSDGGLDKNAKKTMRLFFSEIPVCIRGSIRDDRMFYEHVYHRILNPNKTEQPPLLSKNTSGRISYGDNDFIFSGSMSGAEFMDLMDYFWDNSAEVDEGCWNIFTEIQQELPDEQDEKQENWEITIKARPSLNQIMAKEYDRFLTIYKGLARQRYPWAEAFLELASIHAHMDRMPILHGPSYLVWGCLDVANQYFEGKAEGYSLDDGTLRVMLQKSQYSIDRFVREWRQLTDQITKVDDVVFHRLGGTAAIYNTVSESMLELYHLFLIKLSAALMQSDGKESEGVFSFLLVPTLNQQMRISKMFSVNPDGPRNLQVYIIEFPVDYTYRPGKFVVQLAHECMHIFGDNLRMRKTRMAYMQSYLALELTSTFSEIKDQTRLAKVLAEKIRREMAPLSEETKPLYLEKVTTELKRVFREKILTQETYEELCNAASSPEEQSIFRIGEIDAWIELGEDFDRKGSKRKSGISFEEKIDACADYFMECYADAMAIRILKITIKEYLETFSTEANLISSESEVEGVHLIQRLAIVLTACAKERAFCLTEGASEDDVLKQIYDTTKRCFDQSLAEKINECVSMLCGSMDSQEAIWPPNNNRHYASFNAMISVLDYLRRVLRGADEYEKRIAKRKKTDPFSTVEELYSTIIRTRSFFGREYYKEIIQYHKMIAERAAKKTES